MSGSSSWLTGEQFAWYYLGLLVIGVAVWWFIYRKIK